MRYIPLVPARGRQAVGIGDAADVSREGRAHLALATRQRIALPRQRSLAQISTGIVPLPEMSLHAPVVLVTATLPMNQPDRPFSWSFTSVDFGL